MLSGTAIEAPCQVDLVIFSPPFYLAFSSLLSLFCSLVYPTSFHFIIAWFLTPSPCSLLLPLRFFLSAAIFTRLRDMTGGPVNGGVLTDADECVTGSGSGLLSYTLPLPKRQVCHALGIDIIVRVHFRHAAAHLWVLLVIYLWMKYFGGEGFHINNADKAVSRCHVKNGFANLIYSRVAIRH